MTSTEQTLKCLDIQSTIICKTRPTVQLCQAPRINQVESMLLHFISKQNINKIKVQQVPINWSILFYLLPWAFTISKTLSINTDRLVSGIGLSFPYWSWTLNLGICFKLELNGHMKISISCAPVVIVCHISSLLLVGQKW